jgi:SAM-dependent methyltransferase
MAFTGRFKEERAMTENTLGEALFDLHSVFDVDDYMFVYRDDLTGERSDAEIAMWTTLLELNSPLKILDLACGFGRHANRLAALGHSVMGVDVTSGFLELARQEAESLGVQVEYRQADMRQINFVEEFDRVLLLFTSFGYFEDDENAKVMENMARALKPGGMLGLDIPNRDVIVRDLPASHVIEKGDSLIINRLSFDMLTGRFHNRRIVIRDGVRKDKPHSIRLYTATEIREMLKRVGLEDCKILGNNGQSLSSTSSGMSVIARKPVQR